MSRVEPAPSVLDVLKVIEQSGGQLPKPVAPGWHQQEHALQSPVGPSPAGAEPNPSEPNHSEPSGPAIVDARDERADTGDRPEDRFTADQLFEATQLARRRYGHRSKPLAGAQDTAEPAHPAPTNSAEIGLSAPSSSSSEVVVELPTGTPLGASRNIVEVRHSSARVAADLLAGASAEAEQLVERARADARALLEEASVQAAAIIERAEAEADAYLAERMRSLSEMADELAEFALERLNQNRRR
jgi:hypothetical protein